MVVCVGVMLSVVNAHIRWVVAHTNTYALLLPGVVCLCVCVVIVMWLVVCSVAPKCGLCCWCVCVGVCDVCVVVWVCVGMCCVGVWVCCAYM